MEVSPQGWRVFWKQNQPGPRAEGGSRGPEHFENFITCMRSRRKPNADILEGHLSSRLSHLGNIATRVGRRLVFDGATENFPNDEEANRLLSRTYREPFTLPDPV
jgi:hypothetical protein